MSISWKDIVAARLAILVGVIFFTPINKVFSALLNIRVELAVVVFLGIMIHFIVYQKTAWKSSMMFVQVAGGLFTIVVTISGLISKNPETITILGFISLLLWFVTTLRHLVKL